MASKFRSLTEEEVQELLKEEEHRRRSYEVAYLKPIIDPELIAESEPTVNTEPIVEPEPVIELEPIAEPEPIVELEPIVEPTLNIKNSTTGNKKYKIAIFFRGALRGEISTAIEYMTNSLNELQATGHIIHSYLATWGTTFDENVKTILNTVKFDNVILQTPPSDEQIRRFVKRSKFECYPVSHIYRMYYQTKTALDVITNAADYDYIIHSRTDVKVTFGNYLNDWFVNDHYNTPPSGAPWICDWVGIATPKIMYNAWDYGTLEKLGQLIDEKNVPEYILLDIMKKNNVQYRTAHVVSIKLDPNRVGEGERV